MRVNVQLIDIERGNHLWAERFDKPLADLLEPIPKVVESDESFVIPCAAPESSTEGCRNVET